MITKSIPGRNSADLVLLPLIDVLKYSPVSDNTYDYDGEYDYDAFVLLEQIINGKNLPFVVMADSGKKLLYSHIGILGTIKELLYGDLSKAVHVSPITGTLSRFADSHSVPLATVMDNRALYQHLKTLDRRSLEVENPRTIQRNVNTCMVAVASL